MAHAAPAPAAEPWPGARLSVVIPTWNRSAMTARAVESVLAQAGAGALEVIVVIDGSTDGTESLLRARFGHDARLHIIVTPNRGVSAARNTGFHAGRGDWVCFLDSDDYWSPGAWAAAYQALRRHPELVFVCLESGTLPRPGVVATQRFLRSNGPGWSHAGFAMAPLREEHIELGGDRQPFALLHGDFFPAIVHGWMFQLDGMFIRRDTALRAGLFNERLSFLEDWDFHARLCLRGNGALLDFEGCKRDVGRADELSWKPPKLATPLRHLGILRGLQRRHPHRLLPYAACMHAALLDAQYQMGVRLARSHHRRWSWRYLWRCMLARYKPGKSLVHLLRAWLPRRAPPHPAPLRSVA